MAIFLIVKVLSLNAPQTTQIVYKALDIPAGFVLAGFDGKAASKMTQSNDATGKPAPGVFEMQAPSGAKAVEVTVKDSGDTLTVKDDIFWSMTQQLTLESTTPPTLKFADGQPRHVNVRNLDNHTRGSDFTVEVLVVLGHLRDGASLWSSVSPILDFSFQPADILHFSTTLLNPSGVGPSQFNVTRDAAVLPRGDLLFAERTTVPKMVVIYRPKQFVDLKYPQDRPYPYHIFFHPFPSWPDAYPEGWSYGDLAQRYLLTATRMMAGGTVRDQGKHLIHQHVDAGDKMILVFPVGSEKEGFQNLSTQTQTLRLLQEINYWAQRVDQKLFPLAPIGQIALSGFSFGISYAANIIMGAQNPLVFDTLLKEVYSFDGVFQEPVLGPDGKQAKSKNGSPKTTESPKQTAAFCSTLKGWFRGGAGGRSIRVYTQRSYWFDDLKDADSGATFTNGPNGSREMESGSVSIVHMPSSGHFWTSIAPGITSAMVHQEIPARFVEHAIQCSPLMAGPPPAPAHGPPSVLTITTLTPLINGILNKPYPDTTLTAVGGTLPLIWQVKSGSLPPGVNLSNDGRLSGTPTAEGIFHVDVEVDDDGGQKVFKDFDITIKASVCFIMTAAHGTPLSPEIQFLWNLRESVLQPTEWGRKFFQQYWQHYYKISPPIAEEMKRNPELRETIRWSIVEPWTNYMKLLVARPDWDKVDFASLDPSLCEFLQLMRQQMDTWLSEIELPASFSGLDPAEAVKELNVALTYVVRTGGMAYLDKLTELGELPLQFEDSQRSQLRDMLADAGRSDTEIDRILGRVE